MLKIYIAHQIRGLTAEEVNSWFNHTRNILSRSGFHVLSPMTGKQDYKTDSKNMPILHDSPVRTHHAIVERDRWMVSTADVVFTDLTGTTEVSIGCLMELAWASLLGKHTVVVLPKDNIHDHPFVTESADIVYETTKEAIDYLNKLGGM